MFTLEGHADAVSCLAYSPNGKILASGDQGGGFTLWELSRRRSRKSFYMLGAYAHLYADQMTSIGYSRDGKHIVTTTDTYPPFPRVWRASDMTLLREWEGGFSANSAAFTPDGRTVISVGSGDHDTCPVYLWDFAGTEGVPDQPLDEVELKGDPRSSQEPATIEADAHARDVFAMACSPSGLVVTGSVDRTSRVWDIAARRLVTSRTFRGAVDSVAISPDDKMVAAATGKTVYLWDITQPSKTPRKLSGHRDKVRAVAFHPHGRILGSAGDDGIVQLWDVASGSPIQAFDWKLSWVGALAFSPDGDTAAVGGATGKIVVFDLDVS